MTFVIIDILGWVGFEGIISSMNNHTRKIMFAEIMHVYGVFLKNVNKLLKKVSSLCVPKIVIKLIIQDIQIESIYQNLNNNKNLGSV